MKPLTNRFAALAISLAYVFLPQTVWAQPSGGSGGHMWNGGWGMFFGPLLWIALIAAIIFLVAYAARGQGGEWPARLSRSTPLEILKERYARGEIDKKEFEEIKRTLEK